MTLDEDVKLEEFVSAKDELSGADIKVIDVDITEQIWYFDFQAMCTEAGLLALRERRMRVTMADLKQAKENVLYRKKEGAPEALYL